MAARSSRLRVSASEAQLSEGSCHPHFLPKKTFGKKS
jgi:hypothetical protein